MSTLLTPDRTGWRDGALRRAATGVNEEEEEEAKMMMVMVYQTRSSPLVRSTLLMETMS